MHGAACFEPKGQPDKKLATPNVKQGAFLFHPKRLTVIPGCWMSFLLWSLMLVLMVKERHHIKAHLTDESMFGSEFGGSRRSASRMSNQSFDK